MTKSAPSSSDRPSRAQIEELRRQMDAELEKNLGQPISDKAKTDVATLEALDATKH